MYGLAKLAGMALALTLMASGANAVTLDFLTEANTERGVVNGAPGVTSANFGGENLQFIAKNGTTDAFAYFDNGAGLGVCKILTLSKQCTPSDDDNLTIGETLSILFNGAQTLSNLIFRADGHGLIADSFTLLFSINNNALAATTFGAVKAATYNNVTKVNFGFGGTNQDQYYISSAKIVKDPVLDTVPVPAAGLLLLSALGGLAVLRRKRKTNAFLS